MNEKVSLDIVGLADKVEQLATATAEAQCEVSHIDLGLDGKMIVQGGKVTDRLPARIKQVPLDDKTTSFLDLIEWAKRFEGEGTLSISLKSSVATYPRHRVEDGITAVNKCTLGQTWMPYITRVVTNDGPVSGDAFNAFLDACEFKAAMSEGELRAFREGIKQISATESSKLTVIVEGATQKVERKTEAGVVAGSPIPARITVKVPLARDPEAPTFDAHLSVRLEASVQGGIKWHLNWLDQSEAFDVLAGWVRGKAEELTAKSWVILS